jgi:hypothetical protein
MTLSETPDAPVSGAKALARIQLLQNPGSFDYQNTPFKEALQLGACFEAGYLRQIIVISTGRKQPMLIITNDVDTPPKHLFKKSFMDLSLLLSFTANKRPCIFAEMCTKIIYTNNSITKAD